MLPQIAAIFGLIDIALLKDPKASLFIPSLSRA